ncbi:hypothetical protein ACJ41O_007994 [Fusarium nematophilum]
MSAPQSEAFKTAVEDSKKLTQKPGNDELLELYALYKVGTGEDFSQATAPGVFDLKASFSSPLPTAPFFRAATPNGRRASGLTQRLLKQGKAKYNAWKKIAEEGISPEAAQEKYVALVESLKEKYGYDANKVPEAVGGQ